MLEAHEKELRLKLDRMKSTERVVFAAASAERVFAAFSDIPGEELRRVVRHALDQAWEFARAGSRIAPDILLVQQQLEALLRDDDLLDNEADIVRQEIVTAALYAVRQVGSTGVDDAAWAARQVTDALDRRAQTQLKPGILSAEDQRALTANPKIVEEVRRQMRDLDDLSSAEEHTASFDAIRDRARSAGMLLAREYREPGAPGT